MTPILGAVASPCLAISSKLTQSASALEMLALMAAIPMPAGGAELLSSVSSLRSCSPLEMLTMMPWVDGDREPSLAIKTAPLSSCLLTCSTPAVSSACIARAQLVIPLRFARQI